MVTLKQRICWLASLAAISLAGCSTQTTDLVSCTDNAQCRDLFGIGNVCASDGFCDEAPTNARCTETFPENLLTDPDVTARHIIIGSVEERSADIFRSFERAARLAFKQANARGGLDDLDLGIVLCNIDGGLEDELTSEAALLETGRYLVDVLGTPAIIGPAKSGDSEALFQELNGGADPAGVLLISPSATSDDLTSIDGVGHSDDSPGLFWRTAPPDSLQGKAIAADMRTVQPAFGRDVVVNSAIAIFQAGPYGGNLANVFADAFLASAGVLPTQRPFGNDQERDAAIAAVGDDPTIEEVLFISSNTSDSIAFFNAAAADTGYDTKTLFVTDAAATSDVLLAADPARFPQTRGSRPAPLKRNEDLVYAAFLAAYETEYSENIEQLSFTANAYDAAYLLGYAAAWARSNEDAVTGTALARGLRNVSSGQSIKVGPGDWNTAIQLFGSGTSFDVEGSSGDLDFDAVDEETSAPTEIWTLTGTNIEGRYIILPE